MNLQITEIEAHKDIAITMYLKINDTQENPMEIQWKTNGTSMDMIDIVHSGRYIVIAMSL